MGAGININSDLLQGKSYIIYWFLLKYGESGIREIQKGLNIPSPSTVSYHINKLVESNLVIKNLENDKYFIEEPIKTGILSFYIKIGTYIIPRIIFYVSFFAMGVFLYLLLIFSRPKFNIYTEDLLFFIFTLSAIIFFIYESIKVSNLKPL